MYIVLHVTLGFPGGSAVKNPPAVKEMQVPSRGWEDPLEEAMVAHSSILAWKPHEQRTLVGYGPQGGEELDTTQQLRRHTHILRPCKAPILFQKRGVVNLK